MYSTEYWLRKTQVWPFLLRFFTVEASVSDAFGVFERSFANVSLSGTFVFPFSEETFGIDSLPLFGVVVP